MSNITVCNQILYIYISETLYYINTFSLECEYWIHSDSLTRFLKIDPNQKNSNIPNLPSLLLIYKRDDTILTPKQRLCYVWQYLYHVILILQRFYYIWQYFYYVLQSVHSWGWKPFIHEVEKTHHFLGPKCGDWLVCIMCLSNINYYYRSENTEWVPPNPSYHCSWHLCHT